MNQWFRMWHGAPFDQKWRTIARRADSLPGTVWAVVTCLYDRASQAKERGSVEGYDIEIIADGLGYPVDEVERIMNALVDKAVILSNNRVAAWNKYQPKREDDSTERVRAHRERNETQRNAPEKRREDTEQTVTARARRAEPEGFEVFYNAFPKHVNRDATARKYATIVREGRAMPDQLLAGAKAYARKTAGRDKQYIKAPDAWLNAGGWKDEDDTAPATPSDVAEKLVPIDRDSPEGEAWDAFLREKRGKGAPWANGRWHFPSRYPPGREPQQLFNEAAE